MTDLMINRRTFVGAFAGGLVIARSVAEAQSAAKMHRVGFLLGATGKSVASLFHGLDEGLRELGYVEAATSSSSSVTRMAGWSGCRTEGHNDRLPELAAGSLLQASTDSDLDNAFAKSWPAEGGWARDHL